ncbi:MAG: methyltransferase domain-containing protein [Acidobacteriia bacterium]|nr:methyltransferase domain-containing protein [Methyloceanibacter sp.]MCL6490860.1 methyltransferase domain-containing protein [Terriglobia bacterium]
MRGVLSSRPSSSSASSEPRFALDREAVRAAYRRWAKIYDASFGAVSSRAREATVAEINHLPGRKVLEVGVGTGLSLPLYGPEKQVTGIDLSAEMLVKAREKVARLGLSQVEALLELDAEATGLPDASFDIAVAMFVASVVPHPRRLLMEMRRLTKPGGWILFVNHFAATRGPRWWVERALAPASRALGWHPDFAFTALLDESALARAEMRPLPPFGLFTLVRLQNATEATRGEKF